MYSGPALLVSLQLRYPLEVSVSSDEGKVMAQGCSRYEKVKVGDRDASLAEYDRALRKPASDVEVYRQNID